MPSYEHKKIIDQIKRIDTTPKDPGEFATWIVAGRHLDFLRKNASANELVLYGSGEFTFIYSEVISNIELEKLSQDDLLHWDGTPFSGIASYVWGGGGDEVWMERSSESSRPKPMEKSTQLIFARTFEGFSEPERNYFEINQEYTHLTGIHWRPEERAYCYYNDSGDLAHAVSVTTRIQDPEVRCVTFAWDLLEEYLTITKSTLVRRFDFTLLRRSKFTSWPDGPESIMEEDAELFYRQKINQGNSAYTTGIQLIKPRKASADIFDKIKWGPGQKEHVEFIANDWRNKRVTLISTDPKATTNYFEADTNSLPFELSPCFFNPEVILKYKADKDKYTVSPREITCRSTWVLRAFDVNEAGQVFAYICDLRNLPVTEQIYWKSYNEAPKAGISERAFINDFKGEFTSIKDPLAEVLRVLSSWRDTHTSWWTLREEGLLDRLSVPLTTSRDEWGDAFMDLAKAVVEGFSVKAIRAKLDELGIPYLETEKEKSISLLELLINSKGDANEKQSLLGLRSIQKIRSKVKGHAPGREAKALVTEVLADHETFANHFKHVCTILVSELIAIANAFS